MSTPDYLTNAEAYTPRQLAMFERERIAVCCICFRESKTLKEIGEILGIYQAKRIVQELERDGFIGKVRDAKTGDIRYKTKTDSISARAFFMG